MTELVNLTRFGWSTNADQCLQSANDYQTTLLNNVSYAHLYKFALENTVS